jgi:DnaJ-class molecular chaperone
MPSPRLEATMAPSSGGARVKDPYEILGVARDVSADDLRKAYRKLVKALHPDLHPGDKALEDRFKQVSAAYELLSDPDKRAKFDAGEIDASGAERPPRQYYRDFAGAREHPYQSHAGFADFSDMFGDGDVLEQVLRQSRRGGDIRYALRVPFLDAVNGAKQMLTLASGETVELAIPSGAQDGMVLRLAGKGVAGRGGAPGDALIELAVAPHAAFKRQGDDIHLELPISLTEAVLGARIETPTITGPVMLTIPKHANTGKVLRLKGKGAPRRGGHGDQLVTLKLVLPPGEDAELEGFLQNWAAGKGYNPRRDRT